MGIDMGDVYSSTTTAKTEFPSITEQFLVNSFNIIEGNNLSDTLIENVPIGTTSNLVTMFPDLYGENLITLDQSLFGHFTDNGIFDGYYNVDLNTTSLWHEMTLFQNSTAKRFFAIWGYFNNGTVSEANFIDPADYNITDGGWNKAAWDKDISENGVQKMVCGSFLKETDIEKYYRIPRYEASSTTGSDVANAWRLMKYDVPNDTEINALMRRVNQSSITATMYDAVRMQEVLPLEEYNTNGSTTAIVSANEIAKLFTNSGNDGCKNWANSTVYGGALYNPDGTDKDGPIYKICQRWGGTAPT